MKKQQFFAFAFVFALLGSTIAPGNLLFADVSFQITESYSGLSGEDGTADWIEVTNFGTVTGDTSTLFYEDSSADPTIAQQLPVFNLAPGESAVILVSVGAGDEATEISNFEQIWGAFGNVGAIDGGGLGGSDDIFLFDSTDPAANIIDSVSYSDSLTDFFLETEGDGTDVYATVQYTIGDGAFSSSTASGLSNPFFNDNLGSAIDQVRLAGNPRLASIPEPNSALVLSIGLCALVRRRRR